MNGLPIAPALSLAGIVWAMSESNKRWMTLLWIIVSFATVFGLFWLLSLILHYGTYILAQGAILTAPLIAAFVGVSHMRAHRRTPKGKTF